MSEKERVMSDIREALFALVDAVLRPFQVDPKRGPSDAVGAIADAILAAGWTPPTVKPTLEQVVDVLAAQPPGNGEWTSSRIMQAARAVLALFEKGEGRG